MSHQIATVQEIATGRRQQTWQVAWAGAPRAVKILAKVQIGLVFALLTVSSIVAHLGAPVRYEQTAFALPAIESSAQPWASEVNAFGHKVSQAFGVRRTTATEFAPWILEASQRQGLEPELLASLVLTESSFRKHARSHVGAIGPAQVRPEFWGGFCGSNDLNDPAENIYCGAQVLSHLLERCEDDDVCALMAYNIGIHSNQAQAGRRYVSKVDRYRETLRDYPL